MRRFMIYTPIFAILSCTALTMLPSELLPIRGHNLPQVRRMSFLSRVSSWI